MCIDMCTNMWVGMRMDWHIGMYRHMYKLRHLCKLDMCTSISIPFDILVICIHACGIASTKILANVNMQCTFNTHIRARMRACMRLRTRVLVCLCALVGAQRNGVEGGIEGLTSGGRALEGSLLKAAWG